MELKIFKNIWEESGVGISLYVLVVGKEDFYWGYIIEGLFWNGG